MADRLRDDISGLGVLFAQAADWYSAERGRNVPAAIVEKDFWVTEALRELATPGRQEPPNDAAYPVTVRAVFKGGTSLSKAYQLIDRFSEDVDVFLDISPLPDSLPAKAQRAGAHEPPPFKLGASRIDTLMQLTADRVATALSATARPVGITRSGTKRGYAVTYPRPADAQPIGGLLKEGVVLELVRMGTPTPNAPHQLRSMLSEYAAMTGTLALSDFAELQPFTSDVLAPERTLVDKLCILHDIGSRMVEDPAAGPRYQARHYYDVHQLLNSPSLVQSLQADPTLVARYAVTAAEESVAARRPGVERPPSGFASSPAFQAAVTDRANADYTDEMQRLALGDYPPLEDVVTKVVAHSALL